MTEPKSRKTKRRDWTLITKTHKGVVSILKELTEDEAIAAYNRLDPDYGREHTYLSVHEDFRKDGASLPVGSYGIFASLSDNSIVLRDIIGPEGWTFPADRREIWPKLYVVWTDADAYVLPDDRQPFPKRAEQERHIQRMRDEHAGEWTPSQQKPSPKAPWWQRL